VVTPSVNITSAHFTIRAKGLSVTTGRRQPGFRERQKKVETQRLTQYQTAQRYKNGVGYDAPKEAVKWFQAAVAQGHADAELELGDCYNEGNGVKHNPGLALKLLTLWRRCAQHVHETGYAAKR
jgi:TPR repeat protein